jgi:hypothetical protein
MDKNGNYKVVYGLKLNEIPKGDIKVVINAHGNPGGIRNRSIVIFLPSASTITGTSLTLTLVLLTPFFRNSGRSIFT